MFATPILTIPLAWRLMDKKKIYRIILGLLFALLLSFFLYHISLGIIFRDGMGPG
jgi:4-amino-4-deoxy-L-arabinose transferase-like glycosyltransferase